MPCLSCDVSFTQHVQSFEIESQANQAPFASGRLQATQRELAEAQDFLDDADDGFNRALTQAVRWPDRSRFAVYRPF